MVIFAVSPSDNEACAMMRELDAEINEKCAEIKRMFVRPDVRRRGWARQILRHLEEEAHRRGFCSTVLETGCDNAGAIGLYESEGYSQIPEYPGCQGILVSRCFMKRW